MLRFPPECSGSSFPGNLEAGLSPAAQETHPGAFKTRRPGPPGGLYLISLGWGWASTVLKAPQVTLMGPWAPAGLRSVVCRGAGRVVGPGEPWELVTSSSHFQLNRSASLLPPAHIML